jgi:hypothetical protein
MSDVLTATVDPDVVRAVAWCRLGGPKNRPERDESFYEAERLGLLRHDPIWRATEAGEGVLLAFGLLGGKPAPELAKVTMLWCRKAHVDAPANLVRGWDEAYAECYPDSFGHEVKVAKDDYRQWFDDGEQLLFWTSVVEVERP